MCVFRCVFARVPKHACASIDFCQQGVCPQVFNRTLAEHPFLSDTVDWGVHRGCLGHGLSPTHTEYGYSDPFPLTGSSRVPSFIVNGCGKSEVGQENRPHRGQLTGVEERQEMSEVWERQAVSSNGVLSRDLDSGDQS